MEKFQVTEWNTGPLISTYSRIRSGEKKCLTTDLPKIRFLSFSAQKIRDGCEEWGWGNKGVPGKTYGAS